MRIFLRDGEREKVLSANENIYREKGKIRIAFFPDRTKQVADRRKPFVPVIKKLNKMDVCFCLEEPAMRRLEWGTTTLHMSQKGTLPRR